MKTTFAGIGLAASVLFVGYVGIHIGAYVAECVRAYQFVKRVDSGRFKA